MLASSLDEAARQWSASLGGSLQEQELRAKMIMRLRAHIEHIERGQIKGMTTLKIVHCHGKITKAFINNDTEI